ncbi:MAG: RsmB/NOP family class I SAM-dependent RNA methyltransferase [Gammaproteobacteria bacterium]|nr:RsmB/NOP family class I SAM-dependent RNA methyltransferase [Gammaproteobacteria bacterium]
MRPGARIQAAVEVLEEILLRHRPAGNALADWGRSHRFAGTGDRAAIGNIVFDTLRNKASSAYIMGSETARALVLCAVHRHGTSIEDLQRLCTGEHHELEPLSAGELGRLHHGSVAGAPPHVTGNYPEWMTPSLTRVFGGNPAAQCAALAERAPVDLRTNTLKADRPRVLKALAHLGAAATRWSPLAVRLPAPASDGRQPNVEAEAAHGKGWYEVQDEGSQIAAMLTGAGPRLQILDVCAGAGGKTLAMAAAAQNTGQLYAYDEERARLRPIFERLRRAGARNVQVLDGGDREALAALGERFDIVLLDAPCTGSGTWRRRPDAKWRLKPESLAQRLRDQQAVLALGAPHVRPGGRLVYVTCTLLPEENGDQVRTFLASHPEFAIVPWRQQWRKAIGTDPPASADGSEETLLLTPADHGTDGFFIAVLERARAP